MDKLNWIEAQGSGLSSVFGTALFSYGIAFIALNSQVNLPLIDRSP